MKKQTVRIRMPVPASPDAVIITYSGATFVVSQTNINELGWHKAAYWAWVSYTKQEEEVPAGTIVALAAFHALLEE